MMTFRISLGAAAALLGASLLAAPALAMESVHIPDSSTPNNAMPPDGLFDDSVPQTWHKKTDSSDLTSSGSQQSGIGGFHFSVSNGYGQTPQSSSSGSAYDNARTPGSEFYQPMPGYSPYSPR